MPRPNNAKGSSNRKGKTEGKPFSKRDDSPRNDFKKSSSKKPFSKKSDSGPGSKPRTGAKSFSKRTEGGSFKPSQSKSGFKSSAPKQYGSDASSKRAGKSIDPKKGFRSDLGKGSFGTKNRSGSGGDFEKPFRKKREDDAFDTPRKTSRPRRDEDKESSSFQSKRVNRKDSQRSNPNYGLPFKRKQSDKFDKFDKGEPTRRIRSEASFKPGASSKRKSFKNVTDAPDVIQDQRVRLNKFIANSGVCSRREADELIKMGLISVNGKVITELGYKVNPGDEVRHESKVLRAEKPVYILLNKPKGYLTTTTDPQERNTVMDIIGGAVKERIYPVGRLDRNTTGLLLFTNDGDLAEKLMHPSYNVKKIYKVELDKPLTRADFEKIREGVQLEEGRAMVDDVAIVSDDGRTVGIEIHIGWNRVVRRIFEALEYVVVKLDRSVYAGLDKKDLPRGHWRFLTKDEILRLKHFK